jgi:type VI secretion system protein ImpC
MDSAVAQLQGVTVQEQAPEPSPLDEIIARTRIARHDVERQYARDMLGEFVDQLLAGKTLSADTQGSINTWIGEIDALITDQLNPILHHEEFQRLEATWRGLRYLVDQAESGPELKIKVLDATKKDLLRDMERATSFDQSALWNKVYEQEFGQFGGYPFGALVGDYEFSRSPQDVILLERIAGAAAGAHAPFLAAASPQLLGWDDFTDLSGPRDLSRVFESADYARWRAFRESEDSRYVGLCLPHVLMRLPYGRDTVPVETFHFEEDTDGTDHKKYLWGNAAYALAGRLIDAFSRHHWCAAIRGVRGGGLVGDLPVHTFKTDRGDVAQKCPTEIAITDRREKELSDLGLIPLVHCKNTAQAAFFAAQSCQRPQSYTTEAANANARLSTQLPYILAVARFAHYLKAMMRDYLGSSMSRDECESFLNSWINGYVMTDDTASHEAKSEYPLREARVEVVEVAGKPGSYRAVVFLRPHFQLDELTVSLRLVAELPPRAK